MKPAAAGPLELLAALFICLPQAGVRGTPPLEDNPFVPSSDARTN